MLSPSLNTVSVRAGSCTYSRKYDDSIIVRGAFLALLLSIISMHALAPLYNVYPCPSSRIPKFVFHYSVTIDDWCLEVEGAISSKMKVHSRKALRTT